MKDWKSKGFLTLALVLACLLAGYFLVFANFNKLSATRSELGRAQKDKTNLDKSLNQMQAFLDEYRSLDKQAQAANAALPTLPQSPLLLGDVEQLAKLSGMLVSSVNFIESLDADVQKLPTNSIVPIEVQVSASGSYFSFRDFLNRMEKYIRITDLQLVSVGIEDKSQNYEYELKFKTYYQK